MGNLTILDTEVTNLTPIELAIGVAEDGTVSAKKLYEFLELDKSNYSKWYKRNILENEFAEQGVDFHSYQMTNEGRGNFADDFKLTATFAKKLAMGTYNEKGEVAKEYFIKVEEKLKQVAIKASQLSPDMQVVKLLLDNQTEIINQIKNDVSAIKRGLVTQENVSVSVLPVSKNGVKYKDINSLPDVITSPDLQAFFGWKKDRVYNLMNGKDFPSERFGRARHIITKVKFLKWLGETV